MPWHPAGCGRDVWRSGRSEKCLPWRMAEGGRPITIRGCDSGRRGSTRCFPINAGDCFVGMVSIRRNNTAYSTSLLAMTCSVL